MFLLSGPKLIGTQRMSFLEVDKPNVLSIGRRFSYGCLNLQKECARLLTGGPKYLIVGLTRSVDNPVAQRLAKLPHVEILEKKWTTIDATWLQKEAVAKVYISPHNRPSQFVEESGLYIALLQAGVEYVVKVSTTVEYVSPKSPVYYGCSHWAIEKLLSLPEFDSLQWTSLQPNFFTVTFLVTAVYWIKRYQKTVAIIETKDVGTIRAHLLTLKDPSLHNHARYTFSGPEDVTRNDIVKLAGVYREKLLHSLLAGPGPLWLGKTSLARTPTSQEIMKLAPSMRTIVDALKDMLEEEMHVISRTET
ncbi:hypothetical protein EK21DRAFT_96556 [Setomelanomma holmii]|uniref:NmrA-like domain-containing protein n=1 Tax=Setomelanomma holmii TaxID=210430 RepID=A0A9P4HIU8_9PLEO|nr:hypothetical protein EK21DRAFT_96556 [Setomelanomma holmii]